MNPGGSETACAELLGGLLASNGFEVQYHEFAPGRTSVAAWRGGSPSTNKLCFAGHIDTGPLGDAEWSFPPFEGEVHDGKMYGRGTTDMKAGIASMVCAATRCGPRLDEGPGVMLIMAAGEETGCEGSRPFGSELSAQHRIGALVIAEPTYNQPKVGHRGAFWVRLTATGISAHGSMPEHGDNALYKAARAVAKLEDFDFNVARHPLLGGNSLSVGNLHSGKNVNIVPDKAVLEVDIRTIPGIDHTLVQEQVRQYVGSDIANVNRLSIWTASGLIRTIRGLNASTTSQATIWASERKCPRYLSSPMQRFCSRLSGGYPQSFWGQAIPTWLTRPTSTAKWREFLSRKPCTNRSSKIGMTNTSDPPG